MFLRNPGRFTNLDIAIEISASFKLALSEDKYDDLIDLLTELEALDSSLKP